MFTDRLHRILYSVDASPYRELPKGVLIPKEVEEVRRLILQLGKEGGSLIPRGAGTSLAGQVVGAGVVTDVSQYWNKIIEFNEVERWVRVQPGVVLDELNLFLKPYGLFFAPETSTSNRCTLGGMAGNNACGSHSIRYGSTRDHLLEAKVLLSDGSEVLFEPLGQEAFVEKTKLRSLEGDIYRFVYQCATDDKLKQEVEREYPHPALRRRNTGYALDELLAQFPRSINICKLLAGSEGTLAFITELKLSLEPLPPPHKGALCIHCAQLDEVFEANLVVLKMKPCAVELMDYHILERAAENPLQRENRFFLRGAPAAVVVAEFASATAAELSEHLNNTELALQKAGLGYAFVRVFGADLARVWQLRKAGLGLLSNIPGSKKPVSVVEDSAVAPELLPAYMGEFGAMMRRYGLSCVYHAHIGSGELHLRPLLDLKKSEDRALFKAIAHDTALLVKKYRGSLSGEHGDGRLRSTFIPLMYSRPIMEAFYALKNVFDPARIFNPGIILDSPPMDEKLRYEPAVSPVDTSLRHEPAVSSIDTSLRHEPAVSPVDTSLRHEPAVSPVDTSLRYEPAVSPVDTSLRYEPAVSPVDTSLRYEPAAPSFVHNSCFDFSAQEGLLSAIEQCNGSGDCRKSHSFDGGMCPSFRATGEEVHSTRARAVVLRELLTYPYKANRFKQEELAQVLDECLSCKACRTECPSNVDMTRIKAEVMQAIHDARGVPFRTWLISVFDSIQRLGALWPRLYNFMASNRHTSVWIKKLMGFALERPLPLLAPISFKKWFKSYPQPQCTGKVWLFPDEFTNRNDVHVGQSAVKLLNRLGYRVELPNCVESGRAALSKGRVRRAKRLAQKNVALLASIVSQEQPLIGLEPSCLLSFRDEYPNLLGAPAPSPPPASLPASPLFPPPASLPATPLFPPPATAPAQTSALATAPSPAQTSAQTPTQAQALATHCLLIDEFIVREYKAGRIALQPSDEDGRIALTSSDEDGRIALPPSDKAVRIVLHGHCHQLALGKIETVEEMLRIFFPQAEIERTPTGCCGMAGAFGYEKEHYNLSQQIGAQRLFPIVQRSDPHTLVVASGTSCRQQIAHGTGRAVWHPVEVIEGLRR